MKKRLMLSKAIEMVEKVDRKLPGAARHLPGPLGKVFLVLRAVKAARWMVRHPKLTAMAAGAGLAGYALYRHLQED